jgi:hypothetical protein
MLLYIVGLPEYRVNSAWIPNEHCVEQFTELYCMKALYIDFAQLAEHLRM